MIRTSTIGLLLAALGLISCSPPVTLPQSEYSEVPEIAPMTESANRKPASPPDYDAMLADSSRDQADRLLDPQRKPRELLAFIGVQQGMRVAELGAGGGYTAELLARAVGPTGRVYGQNSQFLLDRFAQKPWSERLAKPVMANVTRQDRPFDDPFTADVKDLDAVIIVLFYHDTVWQEIDRKRMNQAIFAALKPGGVYVIVDHSARVGSGLADVKTLHRIEESMVRDEVTAAGFVLAGEAEFLREPADPRDWNAAPTAAAERRGTSDRFVLKFQRPRAEPHAHQEDALHQ